MTVLSGSAFCSAAESMSKRLPLVNSDGYPLSQWVFTDKEDASFFHGEILANSIFIIVDSKRGEKKIAPVFVDDRGGFADGSQTITVFSDEVHKLP